jgi:hypothetical protein
LLGFRGGDSLNLLRDFWSLEVFTDKSSSKDYLPWAVVSNTVSVVFEKNIPSRRVAPSPMELSTGLVYSAAKAAGDGEKSPDRDFSRSSSSQRRWMKPPLW